MKVKILKDKNGNTFSPKVSADSVYRSGKTTTAEASLTDLEGDMAAIHDVLGGAGKDISVATTAEIQALFTQA